jgi:hypothetical protein
MSEQLILLILLVLVLAGGFHDWGRGPFYGAGWYGGGWLGLLVLMVALFVLTYRPR